MKCKVKIERVTSPYVEPLYGKPPKIIFDGYIHKDRSHRNCNQCFVFHVFVSKIILTLHISFVCFGGNVLNVL
jgi:hypothetical protein